MAERTGEQAALRSALVYAANDTYYTCTNEIKSNHGADRLRLTVTNTVADAGNVTFKVELNQGGTYSVLASDISTTAFVATNVKSIVLPVRFCANDVVRVSFKASAGATSAKIAIEGLFYLSSDASSENLVQEFTTVADTVLSLTEDYPETIVVSGSASGYTVRTPPATSLPVGWTRRIKNVSSEFIIIDNGATQTLFEFLPPGCTAEITLVTASAAGTWNCCFTDPTPMLYRKVWEDFDVQSTMEYGIGWKNISSGTAASTALHSIAIPGTGGNTRHNTGTDTNGFTGCFLSPGFYFGQGAFRMRERFLIDNIPTGAEDFSLDIGTGNSSNATQHTDGVWLRVPTNASTKTVFQICSANNNTPTVTDTDVTPADDTLYNADIVVNSANTRADFYINKAHVGTISTNIPRTSITTYHSSRMTKNAGTTARYVFVDAIGLFYSTPSRR